MHLFLIREDDLDVFAHLHPVRRDGRNFEGVLPPLPAGQLRAVRGAHARERREPDAGREARAARADRRPRPARLAAGEGDGWCRSGVALPASAAEPDALDFDDAWHLGRVSGARREPADGRRPDGLRERRRRWSPTARLPLRFSRATSATAKPEPLEPYMGMLGHAVVRRIDGSVFTHLHPVGTVSMAAAELLAARGGTAAADAGAEHRARRAKSPSLRISASRRVSDLGAGARRAEGGGVLTGVFDVEVGS